MKHYVELPNSEIDRIIAENVHSQRDRCILHMRFVDGYTYEKIAEAVEMSPRYIRALVHRLAHSLKISSK